MGKEPRKLIVGLNVIVAVHVHMYIRIHIYVCMYGSVLHEYLQSAHKLCLLTHLFLLGGQRSVEVSKFLFMTGTQLGCGEGGM